MAYNPPNARLTGVHAIRCDVLSLHRAYIARPVGPFSAVLFTCPLDARRHDTGRAYHLLDLPHLLPPRLVPEFGITDAVAQHTSVYSHLFGTLANPYGAMPSMHTGWSVWVACMLGTYVWRSWWARLIVIFHPILTIMTIIATG